MLSRPLPDLEARLKEVVWSRGAPHYASRAVIFYFENDDTDSDRDAITLRNCLEDVFDIKTRIVPIEKSETWAAMKVQSIILDECTAIRSPYRQLRSLVIIAYIGHGVLDYGSQLKFISADGKQNIRWKCIRDVFFNDNDAAEGFDALAILDCCYAGATRSMIDRVADVLSACGPRATARSRAAGYISFTQRLATAARQLRDVQPFVTVDDLLQRIQENKTRDAPNAQLAHLGQSAQPIALPFKKRSSASQPPNPRTTSPTTAPTFSNVLVKLSVAASPEETLGKLTNIIRTLPSEFNVTIEQVYESTSTLILLSMSWSTFSRLSTRIDLTLIGPIMGPALLSPGKLTLLVRWSTC
ncbi:hypothetical protein BDV33DRAFT_102292 [Aspergillus novoparasiticus]|uniref:Caspase domain-containing protein n=1 Tax=Aspergillus novoparasiticus TaxID=986946 RepID=A0A5N6ETH0_9EURO|nr:hypothetical protein BDV33DRAFT_102292 [Aspergillus novoparasiticus]